ncbi:MAG TPA: proteasome activator, partial [bacterium]|nr:proteasome activator [bacterium]
MSSVDAVEPSDGVEVAGPAETVEQPAKVVRLAAMLKQLLEEVRLDELGPGARARLQTIYETSVQELGDAVSQDLRTELGRLAQPFEDADPPSEGELRVAQAQLVGWLEGLIHGVQAAMRAQHMMRSTDQLRRGLPSPAEDMGPPPGTYL